MKSICIKRLISFICTVYTGVFFMSCGLDEIITIDGPTKTYNQPLYSSSDWAEWYLSFDTEEKSNSGIDGFKGTDIYYKIYNSSSTLNSQVSSITSINTASNSTESYNRMVNTYTYQPLGCGVIYDNKTVLKNDTVFITKTNSNQKVRIRPKTYKASVDVMGHSGIAVPVKSSGANNEYNFLVYDPQKGFVKYKFIQGETDSWENDGKEIVYADFEKYLAEPLRNIGGGKYRTFDLFDDREQKNDFNVEPAEGDADYTYSSTSEDIDTYYVQFFAVAVVWDSTNFKDQHSLLLDLGSIPIKKGN